MSSRKSKAGKGKAAILNLQRMNSARLLSRWWAIYITKPAFLSRTQKQNLPVITRILKSRGVKLEQPNWMKNR